MPGRTFAITTHSSRLRRFSLPGVKTVINFCIRCCLVNGLAIVAATGIGHTRETGQVPPLVLANATLIDGTGAPARPNVTLLIENGRIAAVHEGDAATPPNAEVVDLSGRYLLPGLIDTHVHLASFEDPEALLRGLLDDGVTTVRDMGGDARTLAVLARDARIGAIQSPAIYYAAVFFGLPWLQDNRSHRSAPGVEPGEAPWSRAVTPDSDLRQLVAEARGTGAIALKLYASLEPPLVHRLVQEAHRQGLAVWSHATIFPSKPSDSVAAGVDVLSHSGSLYPEARPDVPGSYTEAFTKWLPKQDFSAVDPSAPPYDELFATMAAQGTMLEPTLTVLQREGAWPRRETQNKPRAGAAERIDAKALQEWACAATRAAHRAGVTIVAGTDSTPRMSNRIASEMNALVKCGLTPLETIRAATFNSARAIGIEITHGSVEVGKVADLVILSDSPVDDIANVSKVVAVVKGGALRRVTMPETDASAEVFSE